jgi:hypothetical protein
LSEAQKFDLYKQQLQEALGYQVGDHPTTPAFTTLGAVENRKEQSASSLAGQLLPRIIINNALGPNKVVFIDPYHGRS